MSKPHRFERFAQFVRTFSSKGSNLTFLAVGSTVCKFRLFLLLDTDILLDIDKSDLCSCKLFLANNTKTFNDAQA